jgi:hypothetical protein
MTACRNTYRLLALAGVGVFGLLTLVGSGGFGGPDVQAPSATSVSVGFNLKQLQFNWTATSGATAFRLLQDPDGASGFSQVGTDLTIFAASTNLDIGVHRLNWAAARYALDACNSVGCTRSNEVTITAGMLAAIGYFKASNTGSNDEFGVSVAVSGDGNTLAVGAAGEASNAVGIGGSDNDSQPNAGAVYVFTRIGSTWSQQAYVKASNTQGGDRFGISVSLSGDGNTLAVGALEDSAATGINDSMGQADNTAADAGAVYVFTRIGGNWSQQAYVKASNTEAGDLFGESVALSGDGNTLAVGARLEDSSATDINGLDTDNSFLNAGAVYVFTRIGSDWSQQAYVKASNTGAGDLFGESVALSGDGNTLAVGAEGEASNANVIDGDQADNSATLAGAAYVFTRSGGSWTQQAYVKASNTDAGDRFGNSVAVSGDGNTLAVGAWGEASNATGIGGDQTNNSLANSGAVYVFIRSGSAWSQQAYAKASNTDVGDQFGLSVTLSGDGNTLAVGASFEDSNATGIDGDQTDNSSLNAGAVYVFTSSGGSWIQQSYVKASNTETNDFFGIPVALSGDGNTLAVGASSEASNATGINGDQADNSFLFSGAVYLY